MIEFGVITSVNYEKSTASVTIESLEDYSLEDVPVMQQLTGESKSFVMPEVGTTVVIAFSNDGRPVIQGCIFSELNLSPAKTKKYLKKFSDGTLIEYDFESATLKAEIKGKAIITVEGDTEITSENLTFKATKITLDGNVEATKGIEAVGEITSTTDVKTNGISLLLHQHTGNQGAPTSPPLPGGA